MLWFILFLFNFHLQHSSLLLLFCLNRLIIGLHIGAKTVVLSFSCFSHTESHHQSLIVLPYFSFEDIRKDLVKVRLPWCMTENSAKTIKLVVVLDSVVKLQVTL